MGLGCENEKKKSSKSEPTSEKLLDSLEIHNLFDLNECYWRNYKNRIIK